MDISSVKLLLKDNLKFVLKVFFKSLFTLLLVMGGFLVSSAAAYFLDELLDFSYSVEDFLIWFLGLLISSLSVCLLWKLGGSKKSACLRSLITSVVYAIIFVLFDEFVFYIDELGIQMILSVVISISFPLIWCRGDMYRIIVTMGKCLVISFVLILSFYLVPLFRNYIRDLLVMNSVAFESVVPLMGPILPMLVIPQLFISGKKKRLISLGIALALSVVCVIPTVYTINEFKTMNGKTIIIPNIETDEYLPFVEETKIAKLDKEASLSFRDLSHKELPIVDGAAAFFPVYSAYVNAVYPDTVTLNEYGFLTREKLEQNPFVYNNTVDGYRALAEKETDIFFGVYPSEKQIEYAENKMKTDLEFTQIGTEAFVFFVHKDNPVDDVTVEELRDIYSGKTRNWISLGGKLKGIKAYQRNPGSGSQSMLERFMGDTPIMKPPTYLVQGLMSGIIEEVSEYQNRNSAIGFSFRYYVNGIIGNPDIKVLKVNGVAPTDENIKNGSYPIVTPIYAVTWSGNEKATVKPFLDWVLSEEGQELLEKSGYVGLAEPPSEALPEPVDMDNALGVYSRNEGESVNLSNEF